MRLGRPLAAVVIAVMAGPAFAGKDVVFAGGASQQATTPGQSQMLHVTVGNSDSEVSGMNAVASGATVSVTLYWRLEQGATTGIQTSYPETIGFSGLSQSGPVTDITISPPTCTAQAGPTGAAGTSIALCETLVSFKAPVVDINSTFRVKISPDTTNDLTSKFVFINGTVNAAPQKINTTLLVDPDPQCFMLRSGNQALSARLTETISTNAVIGALVDFAVNGAAVGSQGTGTDGYALLPYSVDGLGAGEHDLYAEFDGDATYNASNDSGIVGIYYNFVGFQPPINAEGNSIFGNGRVIPVKIKLVDAAGAAVTDAQPQLSLYRLTNGTALGEEMEVASVSTADSGDYMRYVPADQQYIYNLELAKLANGTYRLFVDLGDASAICGQGPYSVLFTVAKKKG